MQINTLKSNEKQILIAYAARDYNIIYPRTSQYVEVNIPEFLPAIPKDNKEEKISLSPNMFINTNFPNTDNQVILSHCISLPILSGTICPTYFSKGTKFIVIKTTEDIEDSYLILA